MITARIEDYLEEIFLLESSGLEITVTNLAERLKITKGTVTSTVQKLVDMGMLAHERYGALHLTDSGRSMGLMIYRRHDGLRAFFHEFLGLDRDRSSEIACGMEHFLDSTTENRLFSMLEFLREARAQKQPWIEELIASTQNYISLPVPLSLCKTGDKGVVAKITAEGAVKRHILDMGLAFGTSVSCLSVDLNSFTIKFKNNSGTLSLNEAATVWLNCNP